MVFINPSSIHKIAYSKVNYNQEVELFEKLKLAKVNLQPLESFSHQNRKIEWMTIRSLLLDLHNQTDQVIYDANGKPHFKNSLYHLSISHSKNMVAVAIHEKSPIGIDIQFITPKIIRIKHKFLNEEELKKCNSNALDLSLYWSCKEALFKVYGKKDAFLKTHIHIHSITFNEDRGQATGSIHIGDHHSTHQLNLLRIDEYVMAYSLNY